MRITAVSLVDFRNVASARLVFSGASQYFQAPNGQGKTNLLEALGLITALRSFRTRELRDLIRWEAREMRTLVAVDGAASGAAEIEVHLGRGVREVKIDGERVARYGDFAGRFPVVASTSQDIQILRGSPGGRRQFFDLALATTDREYLASLRDYHRALRERNRLLKQAAASRQIRAFEHALTRTGMAVIRARRTGSAAFADVLREAYATLADRDEQPALTYEPDCAAEDEAGFAEALEQSRKRDLALGATSTGPHRDRFELGLFEREARAFGSEGQQRGLVLALRLAQVAWFRDRLGVEPVLLADDILGELDAARRRRFWEAVPVDTQVVATGTGAPPEAPDRDWQRFTVRGGEFAEA